MADLPYDPYADVDHEVSHDHDGHSPHIRIDRSSPGLDGVQEAENHYQFVLSANRMLASRPAKHSKALSFRGFSPLDLRSICVCLHLLLVLVHAALFVVWWHHLEHRFIVPLSKSGNISSAIVAICQLFVTIYTVVMVGIMQKLTTRGILLKHQTLTATHDESTAWTGLGSALLVLWSQTHIAASVIGSLSVAIYLMGISVLHISTPSLFNLQVFENLNASTISTQIAMPNISYDTVNDMELSTFWTNAAPLMPFLARGDLSNVIGVQNGTLYDILDDNNSTVIANTPFNTGGMLYNVSLTAQNVMESFGTFLGNSPAIQLGRNVIFYIMGPALVTDSSGKVSSRESIKPPMVLRGPPDNTIVVSHITMIGCTLSTIKQSAIVDSRTRKLVSAHPAAMKTESEWQPWNPPGPESTNGSSYFLDPQIDGWDQMFMPNMPVGPLPTARVCVGSEACVTPGPGPSQFIDLGSQYIMEQLGLYPQYEPVADNSAKPTHVKLHHFENALANMTASMYWAATNVQPDHWIQLTTAQARLLGNTNISDVHLPVLRGSALVASTETHLNINIFSLTLGFVTSLVLLGTAALIIRRIPYFANTGVDTTGVLPDMWMAYRHPQLRRRFLQVVEPTTDNLRAIGMVQMKMAEGWSSSWNGGYILPYYSVSSSES